MSGQTATETSSRPAPMLCCPECSNDALFIEIMEFESHLVNGHLNYVRLLDAVTDHYLCYECGERLDPAWLNNLAEPTKGND